MPAVNVDQYQPWKAVCPACDADYWTTGIYGKLTVDPHFWFTTGPIRHGRWLNGYSTYNHDYDLDSVNVSHLICAECGHERLVSGCPQ